MNPQTGGIYAMVNVPEFDLNDPFTPYQNLRSEVLQKEAAERPAGIKQQELFKVLCGAIPASMILMNQALLLKLSQRLQDWKRG